MVGNLGSLKKQIGMYSVLLGTQIYKPTAVLSKMLVDPFLQDWYLYLMVVLVHKVTHLPKI